MFWGGILYNYFGNELLFHFFTNPIESLAQKTVATVQLQHKLVRNLQDCVEFRAWGSSYISTHQITEFKM